MISMKVEKNLKFVIFYVYFLLMVVPSDVVLYNYILDGFDKVLYFDFCHHRLILLLWKKWKKWKKNEKLVLS